MTEPSRPLSIPPIVVCPDCGADRQPQQTVCWLCLGRKNSISAEEADLYYIDTEADAGIIATESPTRSRTLDLFKSHTSICAIAAVMCLIVGFGLMKISWFHGIAFVITTIPLLGIFLTISTIGSGSSKRSERTDSFLKVMVGILGTTLITVSLILLAIVAVIVSIITALFEFCSSIMPSGP